MEFSPSIFNDVLSPITPGPSSSNTCGPFRIATILRQLLNETPNHLCITMSENGGFSDTFYSMKSDLAFIAGAMGKNILSYDINNSYIDAKNNNLALDFSFSSQIPILPSEQALITISGATHSIEANAISLGGGDILINMVNGFSTTIDGRQYTLLVFGESNAPTDVLGLAKGDISTKPDGSWMLTQKSSTPYNTDTINSSLSNYRVPTHYSISQSVYPITMPLNAEPLFTTCKEMQSYCKEKNVQIWEAAINYESRLSNLTCKEVWNIASEAWSFAKESIAISLSKRPMHFNGITTPKSDVAFRMFDNSKLLPLGAASKATLEALSLMEYSNAGGLILCMPTGGSSSVIPACIANTSETLSLSTDDEVKALLTAGMIGSFFYSSHYNGTFGCQAEIGVAVSMASAAITSMMQGAPLIIENAASLGMQSLLGVLCDPIDGYVQVPCIIRNMTAISTSMTCANAAIIGMDPLVSLDEMSKALLRVGDKIHNINGLGTCYCKTNCFQR